MTAETVSTVRAAVTGQDVTYRFGEHTAVDHVSLLIRPGETYGLLGPNGAGKSNMGFGIASSAVQILALGACASQWIR